MECLFRYVIEHGIDPKKFSIVTEAEKNKWAVGSLRNDLENDIVVQWRKMILENIIDFLIDRDRLIGEELYTKES